jgi:polyhydroxyalkanoate synthesis regulator phasin
MTSDEQARDELLRRLTAAIGEVAASRLMQSLPPDDWSNLARQEDIRVLRSDIDELRGEVTELRGDVTELRTDVTDVRHQLETTRFELLAAFHKEIGGALVSHTRTSVLTMAGSLVGLAGLAMALARFS